MQNEISDGAKLGIVLIALAAVIGLGFGVFAIAKGTANDGIVNVQDSLGTVSQQAFTDFDQKIVAGTQITSALKNFEGKPVAVLVQTKALADNQAIVAAGDHLKGIVINAPYTLNGKSVTGGFLNYNALMAKDAKGALPEEVPGGTSLPSPGSEATGTPAKGSDTLELKLKNGVYTTEFGFAIDTASSSVLFDNSTAGMFKSGNAEFISSTAKFQANLIKDKSGTIVGIVARQL